MSNEESKPSVVTRLVEGHQGSRTEDRGYQVGLDKGGYQPNAQGSTMQMQPPPVGTTMVIPVANSVAASTPVAPESKK